MTNWLASRLRGLAATINHLAARIDPPATSRAARMVAPAQAPPADTSDALDERPLSELLELVEQAKAYGKLDGLLHRAFGSKSTTPQA